MYADKSLDYMADVDSSEAFVELFCTENKWRYEDMQVVLYFFSWGCEVMLWISVGKLRKSIRVLPTPRRNFSEAGINELFGIIKNGPNISSCDKGH